VSYTSLAELSQSGAFLGDAAVGSQVEIQAKYQGYGRAPARRDRAPGALRNDACRAISTTAACAAFDSKCSRTEPTQPETIGQASRISGITPAAISLVLVHLNAGLRTPERSPA